MKKKRSVPGKKEVNRQDDPSRSGSSKRNADRDAGGGDQYKTFLKHAAAYDGRAADKAFFDALHRILPVRKKPHQ